MSMEKSWATGFAGALIMGVGGVMLTLSLFAALLGGGQPLTIALSIVILAVGSYMRYLSKQTVRSFSGDKGQNSSASVSVAVNTQNETPSNALKKFDAAERVITNDSFKLYLVDHFKISKHDVLGKYVLGDKLYDNLEDALNQATILYDKEVNS